MAELLGLTVEQVLERRRQGQGNDVRLSTSRSYAQILLNAVEALSNVTVLCTDKTGTLTANTIRYHDAFPIGLDQAALEALLGDFASSASARNKTTQAVADRWPTGARTEVDEVPFSSARHTAVSLVYVRLLGDQRGATMPAAASLGMSLRATTQAS